MTMNNEAIQTVAARLSSDSNPDSDSEMSYPDSSYPGVGSRAPLGSMPKS
jgi:hypothetical protein